MLSIPWGDFGEFGLAQGSQSAEHDGNRQEPKKITASERLSGLLKTRIFSDELHNAAVNVLQELDSVKKKNKTLAKHVLQSREKIHDLNHSNFVVECRKDFFESFSRRILSPWRLKFVMENFANTYLQVNHELVIKRVSEIDKKLLDTVTKEITLRFVKISDFVRQLLHLSLQEEDKPAFLGVWIPMKRISYRVQPGSEEILTNNNLSYALIELIVAVDAFDAISVFNRQKFNVWQSRNEKLSANDIEALIALSWISADDALDSIRRDDFKLVDVEEIYVRDSFEIGPSAVNAASDQYKLCRMTLMSSRHSAIIEIRPKLEARWPKHERSQRYHLYSSAFVKLFDIVSGQDLFGPSFKPPFSNCHPKPGEFRQYIRFLETKWSSDIAFVAETLCLP